MKRTTRCLIVALAVSVAMSLLAQDKPVPIVGLVALSGTGTTAGTNSDA